MDMHAFIQVPQLHIIVVSVVLIVSGMAHVFHSKLVWKGQVIVTICLSQEWNMSTS